MTPEELEFEASQNLSSFEGSDNYDGYGDDHLDFGGTNVSFKDRVSSDRIFTMNVENNHSADTDVVLWPGYTSEGRAAGAVVVTDGLTEIAAGKGIIGSGSPKKIANIQAFVEKNPSLVKGFKVRAKTSADQLEQQMLIRELSPFRDLESRTIPLSAYQDENTQQEKVVTVPEEVYITNQTEVSIKILTLEKVTFTWFFGAVLNDAVALQKKHRKANRNIQAGTAGLRRIMKRR